MSLGFSVFNCGGMAMQSGTAAVGSLADKAILNHLCCAILDEKQLLSSEGSPAAALQLFRVLQAVAQCCVDIHGRFARATTHADLLMQSQMDFLPCLKVPCQPQTATDSSKRYSGSVQAHYA